VCHFSFLSSSLFSLFQLIFSRSDFAFPLLFLHGFILEYLPHDAAIILYYSAWLFTGRGDSALALSSDCPPPYSRSNHFHHLSLSSLFLPSPPSSSLDVITPGGSGACAAPFVIRYYNIPYAHHEFVSLKSPGQDYIGYYWLVAAVEPLKITCIKRTSSSLA